MKKAPRISAIQIRALMLVRDGKSFPPSSFARALWDTSRWEPHTIGKTGAAYLWRLENMGLIRHGALTPEGERRLAKAVTVATVRFQG